MYPEFVSLQKVIESGGDRSLYDYVKAVVDGHVYPVYRFRYERPIGDLDNIGLYFSQFLDNLILGLVYKGQREDGTFRFDFHGLCGQPIELVSDWAEYRLVDTTTFHDAIDWKNSALGEDGLPRSGIVVYHLADGSIAGISATFPASVSVGVYAHYGVVTPGVSSRNGNWYCGFLFTETLSPTPSVHVVPRHGPSATETFHYVSEEVFIRNLVNHLKSKVKNLGEAESIPTWNFDVPVYTHQGSVEQIQSSRKQFEDLNAELTRNAVKANVLLRLRTSQSEDFITNYVRDNSSALSVKEGDEYDVSLEIFGVDVATLQINSIRTVGYKNCYYWPAMSVLRQLLWAHDEYKKSGA